MCCRMFWQVCQKRPPPPGRARYAGPNASAAGAAARQTATSCRGLKDRTYTFMTFNEDERRVEPKVVDVL